MTASTYQDTHFIPLEGAAAHMTASRSSPVASAAIPRTIRPPEAAAYPSPPPSHQQPSADNERRLPPSFLSNLKPLLARFPLVHISITPDPLGRDERIARLQDMHFTASPEFAPSLAGLADFYRRGGMLPNEDIHVVSAGDMVFHGTAADLKYFLGVWLRNAGEDTVRGRFPVVDMVYKWNAEDDAINGMEDRGGGAMSGGY